MLLLVICVVHVAVVVRDQLAVELAAREGARAAAVSAHPAAAAAAAAAASTDLSIDVSTAASRSQVSVRVTHRSRSSLPLIGNAIGDRHLTALVHMQREPP